MAPNPKIVRAVKARIIRKDGNVCCYCKRTLQHGVSPTHPLAATLEHVTPRAQRTGFFDSELRVACSTCNLMRSDFSMEIWNKFMRAYPLWYEMPVKAAHIILYDYKRAPPALPTRRQANLYAFLEKIALNTAQKVSTP